jgi:hypothetical protein
MRGLIEPFLQTCDRSVCYCWYLLILDVHLHLSFGASLSSRLEVINNFLRFILHTQTWICLKSYIHWLFTVLHPTQEIFTCMKMRRAVKFRSLLDANGLWAGKKLHRTTHAVTWGLGLIQRTTPSNYLLQMAGGCGGPFLTWILTGSTFSCLLQHAKGCSEDLFELGSSWLILIGCT